MVVLLWLRAAVAHAPALHRTSPASFALHVPPLNPTPLPPPAVFLLFYQPCDSSPMPRMGNSSATPQARALVTKAVSSHPVVVFSKSYCPFCTKTKSLFSSLRVSAKVFELDNMEDGGAIQAALAEQTGQSTVPSVFVGGKHIGGNDDTHALHRRGGLVPLIEAATKAAAAPAPTETAAAAPSS